MSAIPPPPTRPRKPAGAPADQTTPAPAAEVEQAPEQVSPLVNMFANNGADAGASHAGGTRTPFGHFMGIRAVDPERDLALTGVRLPKYVAAAVTLVCAVTGKSRQVVIAEAITGATPIPPAALNDAFLELYGYPRPTP